MCKQPLNNRAPLNLFIIHEIIPKLLESVGLDYYDRFEWMLRTTMRSANDNLIVERRRVSQVEEEFTSGILSKLQYGDRIVVNSMEAIADTTAGFTDEIFTVITNGVDYQSKWPNIS